MTLNKAAWAIDGPTINASLAREAVYATSSGDQGIVQKGDLKVTPLATPGNGLRIAAGAGLVLNGYLETPDQMYSISNPSVHTVLAADMPPSTASDESYILAIVVGDAEFSQAGHPFMLATDPPVGEASTFEYVRPVMVPVAGTSVKKLNVDYPALELARIDIPASTTTITADMITDLRKLARPRTFLAASHNPAPSGAKYLNPLTNDVWERFPDVGIITVAVPEWAVKAKIMGFVEGARLDKAGTGKIRPYVEGTALAGNVTNVDEFVPNTQDDRRSYSVGAEIDVTTIAGTTKTFSIEAQANGSGSKGFLKTDNKGSAMLWVLFEEQPT